MKKLMFALVAGVAATVATAAPITKTGFESGESFAAGSSPTNNALFTYASSGSSEDGSVVKAYEGAGDPEAPAKSFTGSPLYRYRNAGEFTDAGDQFLSLSTDGGTLYRSITAPENSAVVGDARAITKSFYIDTLVQFTVCDSAPEIDGGAKLAIWLQASDDETTTNLMVKANQWTIAKEDSVLSGTATAAVYKINGTYKAGTWYRLTVEDLGNVFSAEGYGATGFKIKIDGYVARPQQGVAFYCAGGTDATSTLRGFVKGVVEDYTENGDIFMSLADSTLTSESYTSQLCAVGFSGTGAVDNIMFTEENPYFEAPTTLDFTLTLSGDNITGVTYTVGGVTGSIEAPAKSATIQNVQVGATITLSDPQFATTAWTKYKTSVEAGVNVASTTDTSITLKDSFVVTDSDLETASATVSAVADAPTSNEEVAQFLRDIGLSAAHADKFGTGTNTALEDYAAFVTWLASNPSYDATRLNNYAYTYERMKTGYPIEMMVAINPQTGVITSYDASAVGVANPESGLVTYTVDAGTTLTLSNFVFAALVDSDYKAYALNPATDDSTWKVTPEIPMAGCSADVSNGSVVYTTDVSVANAMAGIGYLRVAKDNYTIKFISGEGSTTNEYAIKEGDTVTPPTAAVVEGMTFSAWSPAVVSPAAADATYTAQYTVNTYTIKFVYGLNGEYTNTVSGVTYGTTPELPANPDPAYAVSGYDISWPTFVAATADAVYTATYKASAPETPTITPAAGGETEPYTGDDAADKAAAAATAVNAVLAGDNLAAKEAAVPAPSSVTTTEAKNAYYANIKAVATDSHTVTIDFSDAGEEVAQTNATIEVAAVAAKLGEVAASSEGGAANIATVPGFYYSILYKASLDASWTEQLPRVLGTGDSEPITVPKAGAAGFYQLKVSPVYKAAPTE